MSTYQDLTRQVGDQWVAAIKRTEDAVASLAHNVNDARSNVELPELPVPEPLVKLNDALVEALPKPSEIVAANFELTARLLGAQRDLTLRLIELAAGQPAPAPAPAPTAAAKTVKETAKA